MKFLVRFELEGLAPENAVKRLKREKIDLFYLQKTGKNRLSFCVERKYRKKVFTIFDCSCYNIVKEGAFGWYAFLRACRRRAGVFLGALLFVSLCFVSDRFVLRIDVEGSGAYYREQVLSLLSDCGIAVGRPYRTDRSDRAVSQILALRDVEFCSLKKEGNVLTAEVRIAASSALSSAGSLVSPVEGTVYSLTVLRGEARAAEGDTVSVGRELVVPAAGEEIVLAGARILCRREETAQDGEAALAGLLLEAERLGGEILSGEVLPQEEGFCARLEYLVTVRQNV